MRKNEKFKTTVSKNVQTTTSQIKSIRDSDTELAEKNLSYVKHL